MASVSEDKFREMYPEMDDIISKGYSKVMEIYTQSEFHSTPKDSEVMYYCLNKLKEITNV